MEFLTFPYLNSAQSSLADSGKKICIKAKSKKKRSKAAIHECLLQIEELDYKARISLSLLPQSGLGYTHAYIKICR